MGFVTRFPFVSYPSVNRLQIILLTSRGLGAKRYTLTLNIVALLSVLLQVQYFAALMCLSCTP